MPDAEPSRPPRHARSPVDAPAPGMFPARLMSIGTPTQRSKALSLPNILTYGRLVAVPLVVGLLFWPDDQWSRWIALSIFIPAAITDYFDGYFARAYAQQSALGRTLD